MWTSSEFMLLGPRKGGRRVQERRQQVMKRAQVYKKELKGGIDPGQHLCHGTKVVGSNLASAGVVCVFVLWVFAGFGSLPTTRGASKRCISDGRHRHTSQHTKRNGSFCLLTLEWKPLHQPSTSDQNPTD